MSVWPLVCILWKLLCGLRHCVSQKESVQNQTIIILLNKWTVCISANQVWLLLLHVIQTILPSVARGDTFQEVEVTETATTPTQNIVTDAAPFGTFAGPTPASPLPSTIAGPSSPPVHPDAAPCSGRPFDAFLQLKNGSIYAFRGRNGDPEGWTTVFLLTFL